MRPVPWLEVSEAAGLLADYPAAGRSGRVPNTRELVVTGTVYILPYRVRAGTVEILRVLHSAQNGPVFLTGGRANTFPLGIAG